jgi:malate dehydrogenase (oxaloacetate-decarboxylating)(NADP+)
MNILMLPNRQIAMVDTHVNYDPSAQQLAEIALMAAEEMRRLGLVPKIALLSHSNFGSGNTASAAKMREALALIKERAPELEVDGEMHADCAMDESMRKSIMPFSTLHGEANLLVCPDIDSANIGYNLLKSTAGNNVAIGPVLLGTARSIHILTPSATVRRIINMTALAVLDANSQRQPSLPHV